MLVEVDSRNFEDLVALKDKVKARDPQQLLHQRIEGNPGTADDDSLHREAWAIVKPYFEREQSRALASFEEAAGPAGLATGDLKEALLVAYDGNVSILVVAVGVQQWRVFDEESREIHLHDMRPGDQSPS